MAWPVKVAGMFYFLAPVWPDADSPRREWCHV